LPQTSTALLRTPDGRQGVDQPLKLTLNRSTGLWESQEITLILQHQTDVCTVRVDHGHPSRFLDGSLTLTNEHNLNLTVNIDNSLSGHGLVAGIAENNLHLPPREKPAGQTIELHETTALQAFSRPDFRADDHLELKHRKTLNNEPLTAAVPLRLTLRRTMQKPALDQHILLVAGTTFRMGRANTWSSQHLDYPPNDLVLRVPETAEPAKNYISNTHAMIGRRPESLYFQDYSKHGSLIDTRLVHQKSSDLNAAAGYLKPGTNGADNPESSLKLIYRRITCNDPAFLEKLKALANIENLTVTENYCTDVLVCGRDDIPETCIFMLNVLRVGYDQATCGWLLPGYNPQHPVVAIIFRLGDGLWITPSQQNSNLSVNNNPLPFERCARLKIHTNLSIDGHQFTAEPWRQHFVDGN